MAQYFENVKTLDEIRRKYGSQIFSGGREDSAFEKIGAAC